MPDNVVTKDLNGNRYTVAAADLRWRPSAYAIVIKDGMLLTATGKQGDRYDLPGGGIELGETPEEAVIREVQEETGLIVTHPRFITLAPDFYTWIGKKGPEHFQTLLLYYVCDLTGGSLSMDGFDEDERQYAGMSEWYPLNKLTDLRVRGTHDWRPIVQDLINNAR